MGLIVQKYGGTSVGNTDRIKNVAQRVAEYRNAPHIAIDGLTLSAIAVSP